MDRRSVQWLYGEFPRLIEAGVIDADTADRLRNHYGDAETVNRVSLALIIFSMLGALLIGLGIILVLAHNWDELSRPMRTVLSFAPLIVGQVLVGFAVIQRPGSATWAEGAGTFLSLAIGASIALVGQTYHLSGDFGQFILTWSLLVLPIVYLLDASAPAGMFMIGAVTWMSNTPDKYVAHLGGFALGAIIVPHIVLACRRDGAGTRSMALTITAVVTVCIAIAIMLAGASEDRCFLAAAGLFGIFYLSGAGKRLDRTRYWRAPLVLVGTLGIVGMALIFTFEAPWPNNPSPWHSISESLAVDRLDNALVIALILGSTLLLAWRMMQGLYDRVALGIGPLVFTLGYFSRSIVNDSADSSASALLDNIYALALGVAILVIGLRKRRIPTVNGGLAILCAWVAFRVFDTEVEYFVRGLIFIALGCGFIGTNFYLIRKNRRQA